MSTIKKRISSLVVDWVAASATVGGRSVVWNQLLKPMSTEWVSQYFTVTPNADESMSISGVAPNNTNIGSFQVNLQKDHVLLYLTTDQRLCITHAPMYDTKRGNKILKNTGNATAASFYIIANTAFDNETVFASIYDLTQMFGTTVADAMYSAEQAQAGAGVAMFKTLFPADNYPYSEPTLISLNKDTYQLFGLNSWHYGDLELRGVPKITDGAITFDGDVYEGGVVTRNYGIVDLGTLDWNYSNNSGMWSSYLFFASISDKKPASNRLLCKPYPHGPFSANDKTISNSTNNFVYIRDDSYNNVPDFKTAVSGVTLIYELATPTEEDTDIDVSTSYTKLNLTVNGETTTISWEDTAGELPEGTLDILKGILKSGDNTYNVTPVSITINDGENTMSTDVGTLRVTVETYKEEKHIRDLIEAVDTTEVAPDNIYNEVSSIDKTIKTSDYNNVRTAANTEELNNSTDWHD